MNPFTSNKILKHLDRILEWQKTGISRPITYELDMTNVCNSKCEFCFGYYEREKDNSFLDFDTARNIILQIKNFGGRGIIFTGGGEPLCNKDTIKSVVFAKGIGLDVGFITNGILLDEEISKILVKNCDWIRISLDAGSDESYKISHGLNGNFFKKVLENVKVLVKLKKDLTSKVIIGTGFLTYDRVNYDMENFVKISRDLEVDYAQFRPLLKNFFSREINLEADKDTFEKIKFLQKYSVNGFKVVYSEHKYEQISRGKVYREYGKCYGHNFAAVISADKKMYLCCHTRGIEKYCIGDLTKNTLEEIWISEQRKKVCENIDFKDCPLLCRCDNINEVLWNLEKEVVHKNFL